MEYTISKGQQYDPEGVTVEHGRNYAKYDRNGIFDAGSPVSPWAAESVAAVVARVIATGETEVIEVARPGTSAAPMPTQTISFDHCTLWTDDQGCPLHGELCNSDYR